MVCCGVEGGKGFVDMDVNVQLHAFANVVVGRWLGNKRLGSKLDMIE